MRNFYKPWGFRPEQRAGIMAASQRGEQDFQSALGSLSGIEDEILGGQMSKDIEDYFRKMQSGEMDPFTPGVMAAISSRISDPFYKSAKQNIAQARGSFAGRGLARTGGLVGLENQYMTEAIGKALSEEANVQSQGALGNAQFRQQGMGQYAGYQQQRNQMLGDLARERAGLYANRQHDPAVESLRGAARSGYKPPPNVQARSYGSSAPAYQM
jgi:hypothetical protein